MRRIQQTLIAILMAAPIGAAISQAPRSLTLRVDNDAFDFWMLPWNRPDQEYSSGVHITYDGGDAPWWSRRFLRATPCTTTTASCRMGRDEIGQDLYTPARSADSPVAAAGTRRNAGWLYLSQTARSLRSRRSDELTLTLGVTGPPSLGEVMQRLAHSAAPTLNRPADWHDQIGFEPGVIVRYEQRWRVATPEHTIGIDFIPGWAASVGNVSTSAEMGFQTRLGWNLSHPWLPASGRFALALTGGITAHAIARDLFLDGNSFRSGTNVGHEAFVGSGNAGIELRVRRIFLSYRATSDSRSYASAPKWHPWASMIGGVTFNH